MFELEIMIKYLRSEENVIIFVNEVRKCIWKSSVKRYCTTRSMNQSKNVLCLIKFKKLCNSKQKAKGVKKRHIKTVFLNDLSLDMKSQPK